MAHSIKIGNGKETKWPSRPNINAKAHEENSRLQAVPIFKMPGAGNSTHGPIGLIQGKTYIAKIYYYGGTIEEEAIKATYDETLNMIICHSSSGLFYFGDTKSRTDSGWYREMVQELILYEEKSVPFATTTDARSLGVHLAEVGQIVQISDVGMDGSITEWKPVYGNEIIFSASGSSKKFRLSIDSSGTITAVEAT